MKQVCGNCEHYIRHFVFSAGSFVPIDSGHCTFPMIKDRTESHKSCKYFEERKTDNKVHITEIRINHKTL